MELIGIGWEWAGGQKRVVAEASSQQQVWHSVPASLHCAPSNAVKFYIKYIVIYIYYIGILDVLV